MFSSAALILAIPNLNEVVAAQSGDVVSETLTAHLGAGVTKPLLAMFVIGFLSSFLAVQAAVSRCIWGAARDRSLPGSKVLGKLAGPERLPVNAIALTAIVAAVFILLAGSQFYNVLVNFNIIGFYIAFGVPVIGAGHRAVDGQVAARTIQPGQVGRTHHVRGVAVDHLRNRQRRLAADSGRAALVHQLGSVLTTAVLTVVGVAIYLTVRRDIAAPVGERFAEEADNAGSGT